MYQPRITEVKHRYQTPHVYRNPCTGTWICDKAGTRAAPGPDSARTVCRTHLDAVRVAVGAIPAQRRQSLSM
jgi:hypothetical protein